MRNTLKRDIVFSVIVFSGKQTNELSHELLLKVCLRMYVSHTMMKIGSRNINKCIRSSAGNDGQMMLVKNL